MRNKDKNNKKSKKIDKEIQIKRNYDIFQENIKNENRKISKSKVGILIIVFILIVAYISYLGIKLVNNPDKTYIVTKGKISKEENAIGYIMREEVVIKGEKYKNGMVKIKDEGEKVAKGDSVFRYYSSKEEKTKQKIEEIDKKIQEIMKEQDKRLPTDIKLIENQIENKLNLIYGLNNIQKINEYKKEINENISKKAKIIGETSPAGSELKRLINEKENYENELNKDAEYITAINTGIVSYRVDGLEDALKKGNYSNINIDFLKKLKLKTGQTVTSSEEKGKIINNCECEIVFNSNSKEAKKIEEGNNIKIRLSNLDVIKAKINKIIEEKDHSRTIVISIAKDVEKIIPYRKISFDIIWWDAEGYRIPNTTILKEENLNYVIRDRNGYRNKMLVNVLKQNDEFSIVKEYSKEELRKIGFTNEQIYDMRNIALYDEILINPTKE